MEIPFKVDVHLYSNSIENSYLNTLSSQSYLETGNSQPLLRVLVFLEVYSEYLRNVLISFT